MYVYDGMNVCNVLILINEFMIKAFLVWFDLIDEWCVNKLNEIKIKMKIKQQ